MEKRYSFTHLYYSKDKNGSERAAQALQVINQQTDIPDSDPFLVGKNFINKTLKEIDRDFGKGFSNNFSQGVKGSWLGPFNSIYGTHLIKMSNIVEAKKPNYEEVKKAVLMDYFLDMKQQEMKNYIESLKEEYQVQINPKFNY